MKQIIIAIASFLLCAEVLAQNDTTVLVLPCKTGTLIIDGIEKGNVEAEDAYPHKLSFGEHYLQLKTATGKHNQSVKIDRTLQSNHIRLGCEESTPKKSITLLNKKVTIVGLVGPQNEKNVFGLDAGDELQVTCSVLHKDGTVNLSIRRQDNGFELYKNNSFNALDHIRVPIQQKGVYIVEFSTNALLAREAQILLERIPGVNSKADFKTGVAYVYDTIFTEVMNTVTRVYSTSNLDNLPRTTVKINLPPGTTYWTYWIGVGQQSSNRMKEFTNGLTKNAKYLTANPLALFGLSLISSLPMLNTTSNISYSFADQYNAQAFLAGRAFYRYPFKYADNVSTDYATLQVQANDIVLCLGNRHSMIGEDVEIRVVAFTVTKRLSNER